MNNYHEPFSCEKRLKEIMKVVVLLLVVLMVGVVVAELGDEWDSFEGGDSSSSSVEVNVRTDVPEVGNFSDDSGGSVYTLDFYIALGVGGVGVLIVAVFLYFFLRKPKDKWAKAKSLK